MIGLQYGPIVGHDGSRRGFAAESKLQRRAHFSYKPPRNATDRETQRVGRQVKASGNAYNSSIMTSHIVICAN